MMVDFFLVKLTLQLCQSDQSVTCKVSDDTDVFVLLLHWVNWADMQGKVQMKLWDGSVLDTNATCPDIGQKCLQLPGMLTLSHCDTTSNPYDKGNAIALNIIWYQETTKV